MNITSAIKDLNDKLVNYVMHNYNEKKITDCIQIIRNIKNMDDIKNNKENIKEIIYQYYCLNQSDCNNHSDKYRSYIALLWGLKQNMTMDYIINFDININNNVMLKNYPLVQELYTHTTNNRANIINLMKNEINYYLNKHAYSITHKYTYLYRFSMYYKYIYGMIIIISLLPLVISPLAGKPTLEIKYFIPWILIISNILLNIEFYTYCVRLAKNNTRIFHNNKQIYIMYALNITYMYLSNIYWYAGYTGEIFVFIYLVQFILSFFVLVFQCQYVGRNNYMYYLIDREVIEIFSDTD